ncbi:MAG: hypothetical protein KF912_01650 [Phycisphaeraceae bacterium]|nr:hypothetical protein [Phycisphaeraceae bacterium]
MKIGIPASVAFRSLLLAVVVALFLTESFGQDSREIRDDQRHFTIEIPAGWTHLADEEIERVNRVWTNSQGATDGAEKYLMGLVPDVQPDTGRVLVLVEWESGGYAALNRSEIERIVGSNIEAVSRGLGAAAGAELSDPSFDWVRSRITFMTSLPSPAGPVEAITYGLLAIDGVLWLHCYTPASEIGSMGPTFAMLANAVRLDPAYVLRPMADAVPGDGQSGPDPASGGGVMPLVLVGLLIFLIVGWVMMRKQSARA